MLFLSFEADNSFVPSPFQELTSQTTKANTTEKTVLERLTTQSQSGEERDNKYLESNTGGANEIPEAGFCGKTEEGGQKRLCEKEEAFQPYLQS